MTAWKRKEVFGDATLYLGDCLEVMPEIGPVDTMVTDPPYGIGADRNLRANKRHGMAAAPSKDYGVGDWDSQPCSAATLDMLRALTQRQIIFGGNYFQLPPSSGWLVWDKETGDNGYADCELAWTNLPQAVRRIRYRWMGMLQAGMGNDKENREHPTQKPVQVMAWCLGFVPDAVTILDPFMGSGTTGVACANLGRKFIGIEIEPKYFDIACRRIDLAMRQTRMEIEE